MENATRKTDAGLAVVLTRADVEVIRRVTVAAARNCRESFGRLSACEECKKAFDDAVALIARIEATGESPILSSRTWKAT